VAPRRKDPKLIICNYFRTNPTHAHGTSTSRTDSRMDGRMTYNSNTALALHALRGKNIKLSVIFVTKQRLCNETFYKIRGFD